MKRQDLTKFQNTSVAELVLEVAKLQKEAVKVALDLKMGQVKNVHAAKMIKKDIARLKTIISSKEFEA
jgi:ribosomal protein L29